MPEHKRVNEVVQHRAVGVLTVPALDHHVLLAGKWSAEKIANFHIGAVKKAAYDEVAALAAKLQRALEYDVVISSEKRTVVTYQETLESSTQLALVSDQITPHWSWAATITVKV